MTVLPLSPRDSKVASIVDPSTAFWAVGGAAVDTVGIPLVAMTVLGVRGTCTHAATHCVSTTQATTKALGLACRVRLAWCREFI